MPNGVALPSIQQASPSPSTARTERLLAATGTDQDHEMEVPLGEAREVLVQPFVGREPQHLVWGL